MRLAVLYTEHSEAGLLMESRIRRYRDSGIGGAVQTFVALSPANAAEDGVKRYTERNVLAEGMSATKKYVKHPES